MRRLALSFPVDFHGRGSCVHTYDQANVVDVALIVAKKPASSVSSCAQRFAILVVSGIYMVICSWSPNLCVRSQQSVVIGVAWNLIFDNWLSFTELMNRNCASVLYILDYTNLSKIFQTSQKAHTGSISRFDCHRSTY